MTAARYKPPEFCDLCGTPHPWASRKARLWQLENKLDEAADLSEADRLTIREQFEALRSNALDDDEQAERWERIKRIAPGFLDSGKAIAVTLVTATLQKKLGLD